MNILRDASVTLLARPQFVEPAHLPIAWQGASTDGERLAEFAGRLCYMSQHNPAGRSTVRVLGSSSERMVWPTCQSVKVSVR